MIVYLRCDYNRCLEMIPPLKCSCVGFCHFPVDSLVVLNEHIHSIIFIYLIYINYVTKNEQNTLRVKKFQLLIYFLLTYLVIMKVESGHTNVSNPRN